MVAFTQSAALKAAIELDLFTAIAEEGPSDAKSLARRCGASERGVRILCDSLVLSGFLAKQDFVYSLVPDSATFLNRHSPAFIGSAVNFLNSPPLVEAFQHLGEAVRKGGTAMGAGTVAPEHPIWEQFARDMAALAGMTSELLARALDSSAGQCWKVLDIAAGHGLYGITIARRNPNAQVVALDWANVLKVARENAEAAGVADRFSTIEGSAFDVDFGSGYNLVLLTNFLHHFDPATCEALLRKVRAALRPGGRAVALEFVPNEDRVSPPTAANFSLMMLASTPAGDAYTFPELAPMFRRAGFTRCENVPLTPSFENAVIGYY